MRMPLHMRHGLLLLLLLQYHQDHTTPDSSEACCVAVQSVITDKGVVVPLMEENIRANSITDRP